MFSDVSIVAGLSVKACLCFRVNSGFEEQLRLYESMQCEVDTSSPLYKQYRLQKITEKYPGTALHTHSHWHYWLLLAENTAYLWLVVYWQVLSIIVFVQSCDTFQGNCLLRTPLTPVPRRCPIAAGSAGERLKNLNSDWNLRYLYFTALCFLSESDAKNRRVSVINDRNSAVIKKYQHHTLFLLLLKE